MRASTLSDFPRITFDAEVMSGQACIRGTRVTVATVLSLLSKHPTEAVLAAYPYLEAEDLSEVLSYAAWRLRERDLPLAA